MTPMPARLVVGWHFAGAAGEIIDGTVDEIGRSFPALRGDSSAKPSQTLGEIRRFSFRLTRAG